MQFNLEVPDYDYVLRGADGSFALVNDLRLLSSFIVSPRELIQDWPVHDARNLQPEDLAPLLALEPELIVIGTGAAQAFVPASTLAACLARGIGLEAMTNAAAARTFNVLANEGRNVVVGFVIDPPASALP